MTEQFAAWLVLVLLECALWSGFWAWGHRVGYKRGYSDGKRSARESWGDKVSRAVKASGGSMIHLDTGERVKVRAEELLFPDAGGSPPEPLR